MKKNHALILLGIAAVLLFAAAQPALALETSYPDLTALGAPNINTSPTLLNVIQYFFILAIGIAGAVALISITISGMKILLAAGNPTAISDARENLIQTALGIALLLGAFILIKTINPQLANPGLIDITPPGTSGVILETVYTRYQRSVNGSIVTGNLDPVQVTQEQAPQSVADLTNPPIPSLDANVLFTGYSTKTPVTMLPEGASRRIRYKCTPPTTSTAGRNLLVTIFEYTDFNINRNNNPSGTTNTFSLPCNANANNYISLPPSTQSYRWMYEEPGIYFYMTNNCTGVTSTDIYNRPSTIQPFDDQFNEPQEAKSMRIVNDKDKQFGIVLNKNFDTRGECSFPILSTLVPTGNQLVTSECKPVPAANNGEINPKFAYVFEHTTPPPTGSVRFESEHLYTEVNYGDFNLNNGRTYRRSGNLNDWLKSSTQGGSGLPLNIANNIPDDECAYSDVPCLKQIKRMNNASYRVIIYSADQIDSSSSTLTNDVCQVYTCGEDFFDANNSNHWIFNSQREIYDTFVIPMPVAACDQR